jgi:hypothetical protein
MILRLIWFTHHENPSGKRDCGGVVAAAVDIVVAQSAHHFVVVVPGKDDIACTVLARGAAAVDDINIAVGIGAGIDAPRPALGPHGTGTGWCCPVFVDTIVVFVARWCVQPGGGEDHVAARPAVDEVAAAVAADKVVAHAAFDDVVASAAVEGVVAGQAEYPVSTAAAGEGVAVAVLAGDRGSGGRGKGASHSQAKLAGLPALDAEAVAAAVFADEQDLARAATFEGVGDALLGVLPDVAGAGNEGATGEGEATIISLPWPSLSRTVSVPSPALTT